MLKVLPSAAIEVGTAAASVAAAPRQRRAVEIELCMVLGFLLLFTDW